MSESSSAPPTGRDISVSIRTVSEQAPSVQASFFLWFGMYDSQPKMMTVA